MPNSVLEAIKAGIWDYEPGEKDRQKDYMATQALPGSNEKVTVLAQRVAQGLPLWHPKDRRTYDERTID